ncbi:MAG: hypothetical protein AAGD09_02435 [Cyanobacteria bacterium P01_F01_bin.56]
MYASLKIANLKITKNINHTQAINERLQGLKRVSISPLVKLSELCRFEQASNDIKHCRLMIEYNLQAEGQLIEIRHRQVFLARSLGDHATQLLS